LDLDQAVGNQFAKVRQDRVDGLLALDKFNPYGQMLSLYPGGSLRVQTMVRAKSGLNPEQRSSRDSTFEKKLKNVIVEKIHA
jgi:hypothetical protein